MSRLAFMLLCLHAGFTYGMECSFRKSSNFLEAAINSCPGPFQSSSKSYCCYNITTEKTYCCDAEDFALEIGLGIVVPVIIAAAIVITLIACCISCLCCRCCPWYQRRHRGTVYGKVQAPNVVHVIQTPANVPPSYTNQANQVQNHYVPYPTNPTGFPQHPPPQYTSEAYAKQAPYNPAYPS